MHHHHLKVGILGCGRLGRYLCQKIAEDPDESFKVVFLWNRDRSKSMALAADYAEWTVFARAKRAQQPSETAGAGLASTLGWASKEDVEHRMAASESVSVSVLGNIEEDLQAWFPPPKLLDARSCDLIVEVSHPEVTAAVATRVLTAGCDYFVGSPTALADEALWQSLKTARAESKEKPQLFVATGAFWGAEDVRKMSDRGTLSALSVTMKKHPNSMKVAPEMMEKMGPNPASITAPVTLYVGPVRDLCPLAPNNVNTMAVGAICAHNLGFDGVVGRLVADPALADRHVVEIEVRSKMIVGGEDKEEGGEQGVPREQELVVLTTRSNPAAVGAVTGNATFDSFWYSMKNVARMKGRVVEKEESFAVVC